MKDKDNRFILKTSFLIGLVVVLSRILGLIREQIILHLFGVGEVLDAFYSAYRIPALIRNLLGEGALSIVFIAIFSKLYYQDQNKAQQFSNTVFSYTFLFTTLSMIAIILFVPYWFPLLHNNIQTVSLGIRFSIILAPFLEFIIPAGLFMGVLNTQKSFLLPTFAPVVGNIINIGLLLFLPDRLGVDILPIAFLGNGIGVFLFLFIPLLRRKWLFRFDFRFTLALRKFLISFFPVALSMAFFQFNQLLSNHYSTHFIGGNTSIEQAFLLVQMVIGILSSGMSMIFIPLFHQKKSLESQSQFFNQNIMFLISLMLPFVMIVFLFHKELTLFLYRDLLNLFNIHQGVLTEASILNIAQVLKIFSWLIFIYPTISILNRTFQARHFFYYPIISGGLSTLVNILIMGFFSHRYGVIGIAISLVISSIFHLIFMFILLSFKVNIYFKQLFYVFAQVFICCLGELVFLVFLKKMWEDLMSNLFLFPLLSLIGLIIYFLIYRGLSILNQKI